MDKELDVLTHFLHRLAEYPAVKLACGVFVWLLSMLFGGFRAAYGGIAALCVFDLITGIYYARADPTQKVESARLRAGMTKLLVYGALLIVGHLCSLVELAAFIQPLIDGYIMMTEALSLLENVQKITTLYQVDVPLIDKIMATVQGRLDQTKGAPKFAKGDDGEDG